ncbi:MAG: glutamate--tRNA ligase [Deltaproteobacteria bacterium]|nr:glutamate--tRNA ligase [Deltaproteobacteria bacterium]
MTAYNKIRVRFAPSPTGYLHIGNARTAFFNWLFARQQSGQFVLRIEDTDTKRSTKVFEQSILEDLKWLGLDWDEGPDKKGPFGPYRQSERFGIYKDYADRLIAQSRVYPCYCTHERLEEVRQRQIKAGWPPKYDGRCRTLSKDDRPKDIKPVLRFKVSENAVVFEDKVHKKLLFDGAVFGDFIIVGSDGIATYNFAVVIDDALMEITHVIRGEDHLSNTPRQILLFEALGFPVPEYAHMSLIFGPDKTPLSKRHGVASINDLKESGFLPEAVVNHLCHLGFSPGKELLSLDEAIKSFSLQRLSRSPAIFDIERLKTFNRAYIEKTDTERLLNLVEPYFAEGVSREWLRIAVGAVKGDAVSLKEIPDILLPFLSQPVLEKEAEQILDEPPAKEILLILAEEIEKEAGLTADTYKKIITAIKQKTGASGKRLLMPIRAALTGKVKGLELEKVFVLLGKREAAARVKKHLQGI